MELEFVFALKVQVAPPIECAELPAGRRRIVPILSGTIEGPRLSGHILPGGADWQIIHPDGLMDLTARYAIQVDDGAVIAVTNRGLRHAAPDIIVRLLAGEVVDPALVYFRATPVFEAPAGPHAWLNRHIFLATGARHPDWLELRVFLVT